MHAAPRRMPTPPPIADLPLASRVAGIPTVEDPYAGTLPASALEQMSMMGMDSRLVTKRSDPPVMLDRGKPSDAAMTTERRAPSQLPPPRPIGGRTEMRTAHTLDTGRPPPPRTLDDQPVLARTAKTGGKTVVDEAPPVTMSRSTVRAPRPLGAFLVSFQYEPLGTYWPLGMGSNLVGRSGGGRPDLDVGIGDTTVSSEQAVVELEPAGGRSATPAAGPRGLAATIEDRGSRNGTSVNGRPIAAGVRVPVAHGDRIRFGSFETVLVLVPYPAVS